MINEQAKAFLDQATQSLQNSQFQQALELVDQAIALDPKASDAQVLRGICLSQLGQPDAATEAFRKAIMLSPYNAKAYYNLAVHQNSLGNKKEAAELAREAVGVDPRHNAAKQLLMQLEAEIAGPAHMPSGTHETPVDPEHPFIQHSHNPGAQDLPGQAPAAPGHESPGAPPAAAHPPQAGAAAGPPPGASPYSQPAASQFSPQGYTRPGYDQPAHSLPWVGNMGTAWTTIGWVLAVITFVLFAAQIATGWSAFQSALAAGANNVGTNYNGMMASPLGLIDLFARLACVFWIVFDVIDRRANWGWVVALIILGCCCCLPFVILPIYLATSRRE